MGTIVTRPRQNGTVAYMAKIILKRDGEIIHRESKTFDRERAAAAWIAKREAELEKPGAIERAKTSAHTLADAIDKYVQDSVKAIGRTKRQVLLAIKTYAIGNLPCDRIASQDIVEFATELSKGRQPQTVGNYISHLAAVFTVAPAAWGYPLDSQEMVKATVVLKRLGIITRSEQRTRRPTLDELDKLMTYFFERSARTHQAMPMHKVIAFALFSTRREAEITRILWSDYEPHHKRVLVRDMKHPGQKAGNDVWVDLPPEAMAVIEAMPRRKERIFPYYPDTVSKNFTDACLMLGINTEDMDDDARLKFHDLRHEGVSRLFEMGWTIPHVAAASGHRSWNSLKRYTHVRASGDKYAGWKWLDVIAPQPAAAAE